MVVPRVNYTPHLHSPCKGNTLIIKLLSLQGALLIAIIPRALPWARNFWAFSPLVYRQAPLVMIYKKTSVRPLGWYGLTDVLGMGCSNLKKTFYLLFFNTGSQVRFMPSFLKILRSTSLSITVQ